MGPVAKLIYSYFPAIKTRLRQRIFSEDLYLSSRRILLF
jgi:hypothetical protein